MRIYEYGHLIPAILVKRKNRFVSEVSFPSQNSVFECYMQNPGSMLGMCVKGSEVRLSVSTRESRRLKYTVEAIKIQNQWIGCNTSIANEVVASILRDRNCALKFGFPHFDIFRREIKHGNSRFDFELVSQRGTSLLEVKTVTMASDWYEVESNSERADKPFKRFPKSPPLECDNNNESGKRALFPDCRSQRAQKHVEALGLLSNRQSTFLVYVVLRDDVKSVGPSQYCDPEYSDAVTLAVNLGLKLIGIKISLKMDNPAYCYLDLAGRLDCCLPEKITLDVPERNSKKCRQEQKLSIL